MINFLEINYFDTLLDSFYTLFLINIEMTNLKDLTDQVNQVQLLWSSPEPKYAAKFQLVH